jgi:hypothetical protein
VCFGLDGQSFEIDLSDEAAAERREVFDRYVTAGRRVGRRMKRVGAAPAGLRTGTAGAERQTPAVIREWARAQGY